MNSPETSTTTADITLYFAPATRATRPRWLLEELGVPYTLKLVDMKAGEHKSPAYKGPIHPHGSVPAAVIDGQPLIESGAIVTTLADRFLDKGLAPAPSSPARARYMQWLFYSYATLEPAIHDVIEAGKPECTWSPEKIEKVRQRWNDCASVVNGWLEGKSWALGDAFSAADCVLGSLMVWANALGLLAGQPHALAYCERCKSRPAFQRARKV
jgi:glutathione S-transferase